MADARKILDERLAKGEINLDQHRELMGAIRTPEANGQPAGSVIGEAMATRATAKTKSNLPLWLVAGGIAALFLYGIIDREVFISEVRSQCKGLSNETCACFEEVSRVQTSIWDFTPIVTSFRRTVDISETIMPLCLSQVPPSRRRR